jgi:putative membrane protein
MSRSILALGAVSAIALLAAGCKPAATTPASSDAAVAAASAMPDANPAATVPTPANEAAAPDFVAKAAASDMFEVSSSKIALKRSKNADVKAFAQMMIDAHTKTTAELKAAIKESGQAIEPPKVLPDNLQGKIEGLLKADIKDFDKTYMDDQVDGHKATLDLMARYAKDGDVAQIKDFATKTGPAVQQHLDHATTIRDALKSAGA